MAGVATGSPCLVEPAIGYGDKRVASLAQSALFEHKGELTLVLEVVNEEEEEGRLRNVNTQLNCLIGALGGIDVLSLSLSLSLSVCLSLSLCLSLSFSLSLSLSLSFSLSLFLYLCRHPLPPSEECGLRPPTSTSTAAAAAGATFREPVDGNRPGMSSFTFSVVLAKKRARNCLRLKLRQLEVYCLLLAIQINSDRT
jgi:hypothetical protein